VIHFALALGEPGSCDGLGERLVAAVRDTALIGGEIIDVAAPSGAWRFVALAAPDAVLARRWHAERDSLVVCNGCAVEEAGPVSLAETLARFRRGGLDDAARPFLGTYNLVCVSPERGLTLSGDIAGYFPIYHGTGPDHLVISNRSTTVARAIGRGGCDLHALAWLVSIGMPAGERVPAAGVEVLPPGRVGRARWGGRSLSVDGGAHPVLRAASAAPARPALSSREWDEVTDDLIAEVRALGRLETARVLPITGGKDSRLLLALAKAAGLTDVETFTSGGPASPEVACAAAVAAAAGVPHRHDLPPGARRPASRTEVVSGGVGLPLDDPAWHRAARANGRYEGIVSMWAGYKTPIEPASLVLKGWGGEMYRFRGRFIPGIERRLDGTAPGDDGGALLAPFYRSAVDPLRVLLPDERRRQSEWIGARVRAAAQDLRPDLVPDDFWFSHRCAQFQGPVTQSSPLRVIANPLVCAGALRRDAELSLGVRRTDRLHFEVMRRAAPELVGLPFHRQEWAPEIRSTAGLPAGPALRRTVRNWLPAHRLASVGERTARRLRVDVVPRMPWRTPGASGHEPAWALVGDDPTPVAALFREAADAGLSSICDVERLCRVVERPTRLTRTEELQVTGTIGVAMLLLGQTERVVMTP
jgi:hypothetical protein